MLKSCDILWEGHFQLARSVGKTENMGFPGHGCLIFGPMGYDPVDEDLKKLVRPDCVGEVANDDLQDIIGHKLCSRGCVRQEVGHVGSHASDLAAQLLAAPCCCW